MTQPAKKHVVTFAEYLALERQSELKHELVNNEIYPMAGGTPEHALLAANVIQELGTQLRGRRCAVHTSDLRVRVAETGMVAYPDVTVVCGSLRRDPEDPCTIQNPVVIVEILSESTASYDRGEKFAHYRHLAELRDYVLIAHARGSMEHYTRNDDGSWTLREHRAGSAANIESIGCTLAVNEVFRDALADATA
jgi:Uma2 family endonuclease